MSDKIYTICLLLIGLLICVMALSYQATPEIIIKASDDCGLTKYNLSESYPTFYMCGNTTCRGEPHYFRDLVCKDGSVKLRYAK